LAEGSACCLHQYLRRGKSGKLKDAAVYWASGGKRVEDKTQDDAAALGLSLPAPKKKESDDFEVWDDNWDIVMMFLRMQTQWTVSMAGYVGLKYEVLLVSGGLFDLYDVENRREVLEGLRIMESAALTEFSKKANG
jgi:hypothetical protein